MTTNANSFANARIGFGGANMGADDEFHELIAIVRTDGSRLLGSYKKTYSEDNNHFNIEIESFGYTSSFDVGAPKRQMCFGPDERAAVEDLIRSFFSNPDIFRQNYLPPELFLGGVSFRPNWIVLRSAESS